MSYKNTHGSGTKLLCASSALGRGQHQKQLGYLVWRQVIIQKEEIYMRPYWHKEKNLKKNEKCLILSYLTFKDCLKRGSEFIWRMDDKIIFWRVQITYYLEKIENFPSHCWQNYSSFLHDEGWGLVMDVEAKLLIHKGG